MNLIFILFISAKYNSKAEMFENDPPQQLDM